MWASRKDITNSWFIERLELVVKDEPNAKLIVYNANRDAPASVESK